MNCQPNIKDDGYEDFVDFYKDCLKEKFEKYGEVGDESFFSSCKKTWNETIRENKPEYNAEYEGFLFRR